MQFGDAKLVILSHILKFINHFFRFYIRNHLTLHGFCEPYYVLHMVLRKISILNYKNIEAAQLELSHKVNCLIGDNGVGKTNFLDALYFLSFCHSAFQSVDSQTIMHDRDLFVIEGEYANEREEPEIIYCGMKRGQKKHFKRNKKEYKRLSAHIGLIPLIMVSPADIALIDGYSEERRKFMDVVIAQYDHSYIDALNAYNKALQQRNALLKQEEEPDAMLLDIWEREMAREGTRIFEARSAFIAEFENVFQEIYSRIAQSREQVGVHYVSHAQRGDLLEVIQRDRMKDRIVGYSLHGMHRDDLEMFLDGYPMKREGSQGQRKTFAIALKLAQFDFLRRTASKTTPILLLDDIFDKLDASRVEQIVRLVSGEDYGQIFITDTNRQHIDSILRAGNSHYKLFLVENGKITLGEESYVQA